MHASRFDGATAASVSGETFAPKSDAGNYPPRIRFGVSHVNPRMMHADPPMARIDCFLANDGTSDVEVFDTRGPKRRRIASVSVRAHEDEPDITTETIAIASAIYWSWWRALDMRGEVVRDAR